MELWLKICIFLFIAIFTIGVVGGIAYYYLFEQFDVSLKHTGDYQSSQ